MSTVDELVAYAGIACVLQNKKKIKHKLWAKQWLERKNNFAHNDSFQELECFPKHWSRYLSMDESIHAWNC
jgi:hypothetical protein